MEYASTSTDIWNSPSSRDSRHPNQLPTSSRSEELRSGLRQAPKLDFEQAMSDFQNMFPDVSREVIEQILRANDGNVEQTIDHLLSASGNEVASSQPENIAMPKQQERQPKRLSRWNPPLVGELPDDFLRIRPPEQIIMPLNDLSERKNTYQMNEKSDPFKLLKKGASKAENKFRKPFASSSAVSVQAISGANDSKNVLSRSVEDKGFVKDLDQDHELLATVQREARVRSGMDNSAFQVPADFARGDADFGGKSVAESAEPSARMKKPSILSKPRMNLFSKQFSFGKNKSPRTSKPQTSYGQLIEDNNSLVSDDDDGEEHEAPVTQRGQNHVRL